MLASQNIGLAKKNRSSATAFVCRVTVGQNAHLRAKLNQQQQLSPEANSLLVSSPPIVVSEQGLSNKMDLRVDVSLPKPALDVGVVPMLEVCVM